MNGNGARLVGNSKDRSQSTAEKIKKAEDKRQKRELSSSAARELEYRRWRARSISVPRLYFQRTKESGRGNSKPPRARQPCGQDGNGGKMG
jgi:hypothetical protein